MTPQKDDVDRLRSAFRSLAGDATPGRECPPGDRLWDALSGELDPSVCRDVVDHVSSCPACAELWRVGMETVGRPRLVAVDRREGREQVVPAWRRWGALAAGVAVVGLLAVTVPRLLDDAGDAPAPTFRDAEPDGLRSLVAEATPLPRDRVVLRWSEGPEGAMYDIEVALEDLTVIHRARGLAEPKHTVPAAVLAELPTGARLLWRVVVIRADGTREGSPTFINVVE